MPSDRPDLSLIVPTRNRPEPLRQFLTSIQRTAKRPDRLEVILVIDDDATCETSGFPRLKIWQTIGPPGRTMGELNRAGYAASHGEHVMLLNDDVVVRTNGWDRTVLACFERFPDPVALVHVNDTLIRDYLCTFPILSRAYCELIGGICPTEYERYRIDDHIEDVFNILAFLGVRRTIYLPDVIFEHCNSVNHPTAGAVYESDPEILARDAPRFDAMLPMRKAMALKVLELIGGHELVKCETMLDGITDSFGLRTPGRQHIVRANWLKRAPKEALALGSRLTSCYERGGVRGLASAVVRRLLSAQ